MKAKGKAKTTIKSIAKKAGVSTMTVSRVLHGTGYASKEIRKKVQEVADKMEYVPNALARSIHSGKTSVIGVLIPVETEFYSAIVHGIYDSLFEQGYSMLLGWAPNHVPKKSSTAELIQINRMLEQRVEGLIIRPSHDDAQNKYFEEVFKKDTPMVCIDRDLPNANINFVGTDDDWGSKQIAKKLLEYNHKSFLLVHGLLRVSTAALRYEGFKSVIKNAPKTKCQEISDHENENWADEAISLCKKKKITAAFCYNDIDAAKLVNAAHRAGMHIPNDLSIVGYSSLKFQDTLSLSLTSMDSNPTKIGNEAFNLLKQTIDNPEQSTRRILLRPEWIEGKTIKRL